MAPATPTTPDNFSELARTTRAVWRKTCFHREARRADDLFATCRNKFAFAGAYLDASRRRDQTLAVVRHEIEAGDFRFFTSQGVCPSDLDGPLAGMLLRDWDNGMVSYLTRLENRFAGRFNEDLGAFCATPANAIAIMLTLGPDAPPDGNTIPLGTPECPSGGQRVGICA
jgi:hypothetical protein